MEFEVSYSLDDEEQFWDELQDLVAEPRHDQTAVDHALGAYLRFFSTYKDEFLRNDEDIARCSQVLLESPFFASHQDRVRQTLIRRLSEPTIDCLQFTTSFLLQDGKRHEKTFQIMNEHGAFSNLLVFLKTLSGEDQCLHCMLMELLYEMSRLQKLHQDDLRLVDDEFIMYLFGLVEELSSDAHDPYHYPVIRVLLVLNEQYMISAHDPGPDNTSSEPITNRVIKILSVHGSSFKTFGENIIWLLNRESETSLQLLILKLLYLLFTTPATYEYFYTNDLRVLVDVMIRNLLDLPDESEALRHTYLRVFHPLLIHTPLCRAPFYKRGEILKMLRLLSHAHSAHFRPLDETTLRLVQRCSTVPWLANEPETMAKARLGMSLDGAKESSVSVMEVAALKEKPGILTPSKKQPRSASILSLTENGGRSNLSHNV